MWPWRPFVKRQNRSGRTFHYAFPNTTNRPRRAMIIIYMPDGTTYSGQRHICTDSLGLAIGAPLAGEFFPVLAGEPVKPITPPS